MPTRRAPWMLMLPGVVAAVALGSP
ncbi:MAG: hypothetical protein JWM10_2087, partial [Myxococcaceae bacterium]|nr:hypothetical protein [Myxococcaceae bacterium]